MGKNERSRDAFISWTDFNLSCVFLERSVNARNTAKDARLSATAINVHLARVYIGKTMEK